MHPRRCVGRRHSKCAAEIESTSVIPSIFAGEPQTSSFELGFAVTQRYLSLG
jgi:hypothetical protein